jgi:hypothetical protein
MHRNKEAVRSRRETHTGGSQAVWLGTVLAAVALFATLLLTVPAGPGLG